MKFNKGFFTVLKWTNLVFMILSAVQMFTVKDTKEAPVFGFILHFFALYVSLGAIEKIEEQERMDTIKSMIEAGKIKQVEDLDKKEEESE
jgi:succinate-acetate transporter protein